MRTQSKRNKSVLETHTRNLNSLPYKERVLNRDIVFAENVKKSAYAIAAMAYLAEGVWLKLKEENSLICPVIIIIIIGLKHC
jgi:hypothetical protein